MKLLQNISLLIKFSRFLLVGLSVVLLLVLAQSNFKEFTQKGPQPVLADQENFEQVGPANNGYDTGDTPMEETPAPAVPAAPVYNPPAPVAAPVPQCNPVFQYNECVSCNTSHPVYTNSCSGAYTTGSNQTDAACSSWCPQATPQPAPQPRPSCNVYTQPQTNCQGQQTCITNTTHNADCTTSTAQPVCNFVPGQCGYSLGQTPAQGSPAPACPTAGQSGTQQLCGGQWGYDVCQVVERFSDGSPARYSCYFSQNSNCQGAISCPAPAAPVTNQCRSISCSSAPANCFYQNQLTFTCNPNDTLTCGNLVCNQNPTNPTGNPICIITASPPSGASPLNVNFTGNGSGGSGSISSYFWDLDGNGSYGDAIGQSVSRVYTSSSNINLQVIDSNGRVGLCSTSINVTQLVPTPTPQSTAAPQVYQTFSNVGVGASAPAPVYYANVKQLPSTGLPLLAWAAAAFVPAGFKLRKLGKINKELADDPNYLWEEREYHRSIDSI